MKQFKSEVGDAKFRITTYKGQVIGVELWPADGEGVAGARYLVYKFPYKPPKRWLRLPKLR